MEYIVKVENKEYGPIDVKTLSKWVEDGRVARDTLVRNSMLRTWKKAQEFSFLAESFTKQAEIFEVKKEQLPTNIAESEAKKSFSWKLKKIFPFETTFYTVKQVEHTFSNQLTAERPNTYVRFKSGIIDTIISIIIIAFALYVTSYTVHIGMFNARIASKLCLFISFAGIVCYLGLTVGFFAQTIGMWYYGLIIVKNDRNNSEINFIVAYVYAVVTLLIGVFSFIFLFFCNKKRYLNEIISGSQIVKVAAKKL